MACHNVLERVSAASLNGILGATSPQDSSEFVRTMTGFMLHACAPAMRAQVLDVITRRRLDEIRYGRLHEALITNSGRLSR